MKTLLVASLVCFAVLAGVASASSGPQPSGQIVFGMNHFCQGPDPNGGSGTIPNDCGKGEIAVADANGSNLRVLTHDKVTETTPVWSPNGEQIAFIRPKSHTSDQIWVMNADGTGQHAVTHFSNAPQLFGNDVTPDLSWSPDGTELVFAAFRNNQGGREQLYVVDVRTHGVRRLPSLPTGATEPAWSPDGRWIAFVSAVAPDRIYLLSTKTHKAHAVGRATGLDVAWSPDSKQLVFNSRGKLELVNTAGTHYRSLGVYGAQPSFSPDGQWIVFTYGDYVKEIRPNGKGIRHVLYVSSKKGVNFEPNW
jgi:Tol biopolymer transport system component